MLRAIAGAAMSMWLIAAAPTFAWSRPSVVVSGDDAALLGTVVRPDGTVRAAIVDGRRDIALGLVDGAVENPLVALRPPARVGQVAFAADGSGVALAGPRDAPFGVVAFDA